MHAALIEAVPPACLLPFAEATEKFSAVVADHIVLARYVKSMADARFLHQPRQGIELVRPGEVREIARMQQKGQTIGLGVDQRQRLAKRGCHIHVRRLVEANMRIADLHEAETGVFGGSRRAIAKRLGVQHAALHQP